jgi:hypothetical protein
MCEVPSQLFGSSARCRKPWIHTIHSGAGRVTGSAASAASSIWEKLWAGLDWTAFIGCIGGTFEAAAVEMPEGKRVICGEKIERAETHSTFGPIDRTLGFLQPIRG